VSEEAKVDQLPTVINIERPDPAIAAGASAALAAAEGYVIDSQVMYEAADEDLAEWSRREKVLEEARVKLKAPILEAGRGIDGFFNVLKAPLTQARTVIKGKMSKFLADQERARREQEARIADELRKKREAEEAEARKLAEAGKIEEAAAIQAAAAAMPTHVALAPAPTAAHSTGAKTWVVDGEIDMAALVKAAATRPELMIYLLPNEKMINATVKNQKAATAIPGVKVKEQIGIRAKGGRR